MFGNVGNNNTERSTNTRIRTFYSDLSCLQLTYWNENISIKINPLQSVSAEGIRQYDFNRKVNTALTSDKCIALKEKIDERILPKIKEVNAGGSLEKPVNTGLQVGTKGTAVFIEYKKEETDDKPFVYLTVYTNIGQDGKAPKDGAYSYKFAKVNTIDDYDPESGTGTDSFVDAEFMFFYEKLKNIADVCGVAAHSVNMDNTHKSTNSNKGNFNNGFSGGNNTPSNGTYSAPVSSFNSEEFPFS